jgi:hypothetical protein
VFGSHTEYWTPGMRATLDAALAAGANAVFFGANSIYWHPVPVGTTQPYRALAIWKVASLDPHAGDPNLSSEQWRQAPVANPEQSLLGEQFGCTNVLEPMTVPSPLGWVFQGSGAVPGERLPGVIYQETDYTWAGAVPAGARTVTGLSFSCPQNGIASGGSAMAIAPASGGGLVMDVGTRGWACLLNASCVTNPVYLWPGTLNRNPDIQGPTVRNDAHTVRVVQNVTATVLSAISGGPAGNLVSSARSYPLIPGG